MEHDQATLRIRDLFGSVELDLNGRAQEIGLGAIGSPAASEAGTTRPVFIRSEPDRARIVHVA